jgi:hypothetical protein
MKRTDKNLDTLLDETVAGIRSDAVDASVVDAAAQRVLARLEQEGAVSASRTTPIVEHIRGCADFQALIPAYLLGSLSPARVLLLEDHTSECLSCRKALKQARTGNVVAPIRKTAGANSRFDVYKRTIAAALVLGVGYLGVLFVQNVMYSDGTAEAVVQAVNGLVQQVSDAECREVTTGAKVGAGQRLRTARGAGAVVRLEDGSLVEMAERSEISISENASGTTIHLDQGNVIVQAAKQRSGHLYVATGDCLVSVTGTIFSVNHGTKGSRVSVLEGEVHVDHSGRNHVIHPGQQVSTAPSLGAVPISEEIAWSRDAQRYGAVLAGLADIQTALNKVPRPGVRYSTRLLELAPEQTAFYAAIPNLSETLGASHKILQERIDQNPALRAWWGEQRGERKGEDLGQVIERVRELGSQLGPEIVVTAEMDERGDPMGPLVLAELRDPAAFRSFLEAQLAALPAGPEGRPNVRLVDNPSSLASLPNAEGEKEEFLVWIADDLLVATPDRQQLQRVAARMVAGGANSFTATPFHASIASLYREGAGLIVAADLHRIIAETMREGGATAENARERESYQQLGLFNLQHLIAEQKESDGKTRTRAVLTFDEPRTGIASWLAAPGPMKALEFVSPDANVVTAFVVREPVALVDDLFNFLQTADPEMRRQLAQLETEHGIDIRKDFAAPLGGEFAFAVDGPLLPTPSWKMVFEVYDPAHLQQAFERIVDELNKNAAAAGKQGFQWERAEVGGRAFYTLRSIELGLEVNYAFADGYLVAGPSRALVENALRFHDSGYTLLNSQRFTAALPADGNVNFSALLYHDLAPLVEPVARHLGGARGALPQEQQQAIRSLASAAPTLAYAYADGDRITFAANSEGGPFGLSPASLLGMPGSFGLQHMLGQAMGE